MDPHLSIFEILLTIFDRYLPFAQNYSSRQDMVALLQDPAKRVELSGAMESLHIIPHGTTGGSSLA